MRSLTRRRPNMNAGGEAAARGRILKSLPSTEDIDCDPELFRQMFAGMQWPLASTMAVGVTSAVRGEGRTTIAFGLARTLALDLDMPVTLVDADLDNPTLSRQCRLASSSGLSDVLRDGAPLEQVVQPIRQNLFCVPAGNARDDAPRLMRLLASRDVLRGSAGLIGLVILDLPSVMGNVSGSFVARACDSTILVIRARVTPVILVRQAIDRLGIVPQGVVLNGVSSAIPKWLGGRA